MGQKVNPIGLRIGINRGWAGRWYANRKNYAAVLHEDIAIRKYINEKIKDAGISLVEIERSSERVTVNINTAKPGIVIGRQGSGVEKLKAEMEGKFGKKIQINIVEIAKPELDAKVISEDIANQITRRVNYRRAAKMALKKAMEAGAKGIKIRIAGRLNGVDIAREETYKEGNIPLHTFRADIDYDGRQAHTAYGVIGLKVWVYKGEVFQNGVRYNDNNKKSNNNKK